MRNKFTVFTLAILILLLVSGFAIGQAMQFEVLFNCNMSVQKLSGLFDPLTDTLDVRGSFNGWAGPTDILDPNILNDDLYQVVVFDSLVPVTDTVFYKYVITAAGNTIWENVTIDPIGGNRWFNTTGNEPDLNDNQIPDVLLDTVYFSDVGPDDIFTQETDIVFEADMRPAYKLLADSGNIGFPPASGNVVNSIDTVYFAGGVPLTDPELLWVWDFANDPRIKELKMNDLGQNGDLMAGDSVWSITITFMPGAAKVLSWKDGIAGLAGGVAPVVPIDNEADFAQNHTADVSTFGGRVHYQFGDNGSWYNTYLGIEPGHNFYNLPESYILSQNYPNPFNPSTKIEYAINKRVKVSMEIYNVIGQKVRTLFYGVQSPGTYELVWDGKNDIGQQVSSGVYLYIFTAGQKTEVRKMMLMK